MWAPQTLLGHQEGCGPSCPSAAQPRALHIPLSLTWGGREQCHKGGCGHQLSPCRRVGLKHRHGVLGTSPLSLQRGEAEPDQFCPATPRPCSASEPHPHPAHLSEGCTKPGQAGDAPRAVGSHTPPRYSHPKQGAEGQWGPAGAGDLDACPPWMSPFQEGSQRCPTAAGLGT